jgi:hypothetical protein
MPIDRRTTLTILRRLARTSLGEYLILGGSSGLHAVSEKIPALTEDVDLLIDAEWVAAHEDHLLSEMARAGFQHHAGTCTLTDEEGQSVDLVGYSRQDQADRIGGGERVPVMVFGDLSTLLRTPASVADVSAGGQALSAAALTVAKLMTIRVEKGSKDKLQALLLIDEMRHDEGYLAELRGFLDEFEPDRIEDAVADAQAAMLAISSDAEIADAEARGYQEMRTAISRGLAILENLTGNGEPS